MKKKIPYLLLIIAQLILFIGCSEKEKPKLHFSKQPIEVKVSVDSPNVKIGDLIHYTIEVDAASNVWFHIPQFMENVGGLAVNNVNIMEKKRDPQSGRVSQKQIYDLETYLVGDYEIPSTNIIYAINGKTNYISGTPIFIRVSSVATTNDTFAVIRDIKPPLGIKALEQTVSKKYLYAIIAALVAALIVLLFVRKRKRIENIEKAPPLPAHIKALNALKELDEKHLIENNKIKEFYYELTNILRHYIEDRFRLKAPEQTTEEFLRELKNDINFLKEYRPLLKKFLTECDLIKYANYSTSPENAKSAEDTTLDFIQETKEIQEINNN